MKTNDNKEIETSFPFSLKRMKSLVGACKDSGEYVAKLQKNGANCASAYSLSHVRLEQIIGVFLNR